ncbi:MAG: hypothetical protein IPK74_23580 [Deltaproteobacteria bacterium]|nr:hypothetical protein [Deltaproteobacteria bacterium]
MRPTNRLLRDALRLTAISTVISACAGAPMSRFVGDGDDIGGAESSDDGGTASVTVSAGEAETGTGETGGSDDAPATSLTGDATAADSSTTAPATSDASTGDPTDASSEGSGSSGGVTTEAGSSSSDGGMDSGVGQDVDLSGWVVVQTASDREFVIPDGTVVSSGGTLVIGRNASPGAFQNFWAVNWGSDVTYLDGIDQFPSINGAETYALRMPDTTLVDGPTPALDLSTGSARNDADGNGAAAWDVTLFPNDDATPGSSTASGGTPGVPFISEVADPTGAGNFVYEFVEIHVP